jgi:hypothetical protein
VLPVREPRRDRRLVAGEVHETDVARGADARSVGLLQRRARGTPLPPAPRSSAAPTRAGRARPTVLVGERRAGGHLRDGPRRMEVVGVDEAQAEPLRQRGADRALAAAGHAHHDHDHPCFPGPAPCTAWPPNACRIIASIRFA